MEKIVKDGLRDCTVYLDGSECAVRFDTCFRVFAVRNDSGADVFISKTSGIVPDADGVMCVKSGASAVFAHMDIYADTVYLLGNGRVQVHAQNDSANPFNFAPTIDGGVQACGNPVQLDGLQGGVPFSEMVVSGKNLLTYPYNETTKTVNGITFTDNGDGSITVNGTASAETKYYLSLPVILPKGKYTIGFENQDESCSVHVYLFESPYTTFAISYINPNFVLAENTKLTIRIVVKSGKSFSNFLIRPQLELGSEATAYEPPITGRELTVNVNGTDYTITPDTNPYTISDDIRQKEGLNNITVSEGEISVTGVRKNAAIKKIWDDMSMDLLFDGLALLASPAENIDLGNYSKYLINCYYDPNAVSKGHCISIVVEYDRLKNIVHKAGVLIHSLYTSYALELHFSGTMDNANYYAKQNNDENASYYTRIYGIK